MSASDLVTLRFQSGGGLSGLKGTAVRKGIYWTDADEAVYQAAAAQQEFEGKKPRDEAERVAREFAIACACGRRLKAEFERAAKCKTPNDKRALYQEWAYLLGKAAADRIAAGFKDEAERARVLAKEFA
jgi:hypothetical protein